jgi:hypothetical protein
MMPYLKLKSFLRRRSTTTKRAIPTYRLHVDEV